MSNTHFYLIKTARRATPVVYASSWMTVAEGLGVKLRQSMEYDGDWQPWIRRNPPAPSKGVLAHVATIANSYEFCVVLHRTTGERIAEIYRASNPAILKQFTRYPRWLVTDLFVTILRRVTKRKKRKS